MHCGVTCCRCGEDPCNGLLLPQTVCQSSHGRQQQAGSSPHKGWITASAPGRTRARFRKLARILTGCEQLSAEMDEKELHACDAPALEYA